MPKARVNKTDNIIRRIKNMTTTMSDDQPVLKGNLMKGKKGLIMGVANDRSIAWGIASALAAQGAELAFTYQGEALERRVRPLADSVGSKLVMPCDVTSPQSIDETFATLKKDGVRLISSCMPSHFRTKTIDWQICRHIAR